MRSTRMLVLASLLIATLAAVPAASAHMTCGQGMCCGFDGDPDPGSPDALADQASHSLCFVVWNVPGIVGRVGDLVECIRSGDC